ncbi:MAG: head maturation protease, ClpP-related, partial [Pseudomonadota bacterium]
MRADVSSEAFRRWNPSLQAANADAATIPIMQPIGQDMWGEGVTARRVETALSAIGDRPVNVPINSPGGDVFEGAAIYELLRAHARDKGEVTVQIMGLAASAASIIAMAGDNILIGQSSFLMIHNSWVIAIGDRNALREVSDWLEPFDAAMAGVYEAQT